jgi:hypothetical protein
LLPLVRSFFKGPVQRLHLTLCGMQPAEYFL